ncbi:MAG: energy transducer TonB [Polymorphobacter sp.]
MLFAGSALAEPAKLLNEMFFISEDYPLASRQAGEEGATRVDVSVDVTGRPVACKVIKSSSSDRLDRAACDAAMRRAMFKPATDAKGNPVVGVSRQVANFKLVSSAMEGKPRYEGYGVDVAFDEQGEVITCEVIPLSRRSKLTDGQKAKCGTMGNRGMFAALLGRPTIGLGSATFRVYRDDSAGTVSINTKFPLYRILTHVVYDRTANGTITWCEVRVSPAVPELGLTENSLCGAGGFGVTAAPNGGVQNTFLIDVGATGRSPNGG